MGRNYSYKLAHLTFPYRNSQLYHPLYWVEPGFTVQEVQVQMIGFYLLFDSAVVSVGFVPDRLALLSIRLPYSALLIVLGFKEHREFQTLALRLRGLHGVNVWHPSTLIPQSGDEAESTGELHEALTIDRVIHEPARLAILAVLSKAEEVDFTFLLLATGLSKGNLSKQTSKLDEAGYITVRKYFKGRVPATGYRLTDRGRTVFAHSWQQMNTLAQGLQPAGNRDSEE